MATAEGVVVGVIRKVTVEADPTIIGELGQPILGVSVEIKELLRGKLPAQFKVLTQDRKAIEEGAIVLVFVRKETVNGASFDAFGGHGCLARDELVPGGRPGIGDDVLQACRNAVRAYRPATGKLEQQARSLNVLNEDAWEAFIPLLGHDSPEVRRWAVIQMSQLRLTANVNAAIEKRLDDDVASVRDSAFEALIRSRALNPDDLRRRLQDGDFDASDESRVVEYLQECEVERQLAAMPRSDREALYKHVEQATSPKAPWVAIRFRRDVSSYRVIDASQDIGPQAMRRLESHVARLRSATLKSFSEFDLILLPEKDELTILCRRRK